MLLKILTSFRAVLASKLSTSFPSLVDLVAHPLCRAVEDYRRERVTEGWGPTHRDRDISLSSTISLWSHPSPYASAALRCSPEQGAVQITSTLGKAWHGLVLPSAFYLVLCRAAAPSLHPSRVQWCGLCTSTNQHTEMLLELQWGL